MRGSGARGQITREDVERAAAGPTAAPPAAAPVPPPAGEDRIEPLQGLRRQIAVTMEAAWHSVPHIYTNDEIDASALVGARRALNEDLAAGGVKLSFLPFFVKACAAALRRHPRFNASLDMEGQRIVYRHRCNIGIATATPDGLIVTVVHDADRKSLVAIGAEIDEMARLARDRSIPLEKLSNGTFTISNFGSYGGWMGTPIIRPPEVAIAGFGQIRDRVVPVAGAPAVRATLPVVVSTDHRLNDGEHLQGFFDTMTGYLREPIRFLGQELVGAPGAT